MGSCGLSIVGVGLIVELVWGWGDNGQGYCARTNVYALNKSAVRVEYDMPEKVRIEIISVTVIVEGKFGVA